MGMLATKNEYAFMGKKKFGGFGRIYFLLSISNYYFIVIK